MPKSDFHWKFYLSTFLLLITTSGIIFGMPDKDTDYDSDSSAQSSSSLSTEALRRELKSIADASSFLHSFKPESTSKAKVGRPSKKPKELQDFGKTLSQLFNFNHKILDLLERVQQDNLQLKGEVHSSYASITATNSKQVDSQLTASSNSNSPRLDSLDSRIDLIEQKALSNHIKLEGDLCQPFISDYIASSPKNVDLLKCNISSEINKVKPDLLQAGEIESVHVIGNDKKHLKIRLTNTTSRISILKAFKTQKPSNIFISEYLTKTRANLYYKLRATKRLNPKIKAAYIFGGSICCKTTEDDKVHQLNTVDSLDKFIESLSRGTTANE